MENQQVLNQTHDDIVVPESLSDMEYRLRMQHIADEAAKETAIEKRNEELSASRDRIKNFVSQQQYFVQQEQSGQMTPEMQAAKQKFEQDYYAENDRIRQTIYDKRGILVDYNYDLVQAQHVIDELCQSVGVTGTYTNIADYDLVGKTILKELPDGSSVNVIENPQFKISAAHIPQDIKTISKMVKKLSNNKISSRRVDKHIWEKVNEVYAHYSSKNTTALNNSISVVNRKIDEYTAKLSSLESLAVDNSGSEVMRNMEIERYKAKLAELTGRLQTLEYMANAKNYDAGDVALSMYSVSFKAENSPKNTRIILSILNPTDYANTGDLIVYAQESRDRFMVRVNRSNFSTQNDFNIFMANIIVDFFSVGVKLTENKLMMEKTGNTGLALIAEIISKTGRYNVAMQRYQTRVSALKITSKGRDNQWLYVTISETTLTGTYKIDLYNNVDYTWNQTFQLNNRPITIDWLETNIVKMLDKWYATDYSKSLDEKELLDAYIMRKFNYVKMSSAVYEIIITCDDNPQYGIELKEALSRKDTEVKVPEAYKAEILIGKTNKVEFFILSYMGVYFKHLNNRLMMFDIEYKIKGNDEVQKAVFRSFEELRAETGIFDDQPKTINHLTEERIALENVGSRSRNK